MGVVISRRMRRASNGLRLPPILGVTALILARFLHTAPPLVSAGGRSVGGRQEKHERGVRIVDPAHHWLNGWLNGEIVYIITDEERSIFKRLTTDEERDRFIEQFWQRRNPEPGSFENRFKQEFYRRIVYANERFSSTVPGWKSDRGRVYILYGPPDMIEWHPNGGALPLPDGTSQVVSFGFGQWRYRRIEGIGRNIEVDWVDPTNTGEYHIALDPGKGDPFSQREFAFGLTEPGDLNAYPEYLRLPHVCGVTAGQEWREAPAGPGDVNPYTGAFSSPRLPDLQAAMASHRKLSNPIKLVVRTYSVPATEQTDLMLIALEMPNQDLNFQQQGGGMHGQVEIYGHVENLSGSSAGEFGKKLAVDLPKDAWGRQGDGKSVFEEGISLRPGYYRLSVGVKDETSGRTGLATIGLKAPAFEGDLLITSSLILADSIEAATPTVRNAFTIGAENVLSNPSQVFSREGNLGAYLQIQNLGIDRDTYRPNISIEYEITKNGRPVYEEPEDAARLAQASTEFTAVKVIPLKTIPPGRYTLQIEITDRLRARAIAPATTFEVC